jgi:hypothetical protein
MRFGGCGTKPVRWCAAAAEIRAELEEMLDEKTRLSGVGPLYVAELQMFE